MSYCGSCGSFYWPGCPRRPDGVCTPAPNPHDEAHADKLARVAALNAEVAAMVAENEFRTRNGNAIAYGDEQFGAALARWGIPEKRT